jgi:hypothetical protein
MIASLHDETTTLPFRVYENVLTLSEERRL